jgi:hypothetical protein
MMTAEREYIEAMLRMVRRQRDLVGCDQWETELLRIDNPKAWAKKRMNRALTLARERDDDDPL